MRSHIIWFTQWIIPKIDSDVFWGGKFSFFVIGYYIGIEHRNYKAVWMNWTTFPIEFKKRKIHVFTTVFLRNEMLIVIVHYLPICLLPWQAINKWLIKFNACNVQTFNNMVNKQCPVAMAVTLKKYMVPTVSPLKQHINQDQYVHMSVKTYIRKATLTEKQEYFVIVLLTKMTVWHEKH